MLANVFFGNMLDKLFRIILAREGCYSAGIDMAALIKMLFDADRFDSRCLINLLELIILQLPYIHRTVWHYLIENAIFLDLINKTLTAL